jgi:hypothetical protein
MIEHLARQGWYVAGGSLVPGDPAGRVTSLVLREARLGRCIRVAMRSQTLSAASTPPKL